jgi:bacterial/archaeal transporter family-2 protein
MNNPGWLLVPVVMGICQPVIWQMTLRLAKTVGDMPAAALLHLVGGAAGGLFILMGLRGGDGEWSSLPWWAWLGGAIGVCCLWLLNMTIPKLGVATMMALLVASQLVAGLVFEKYGLLGAQLREPQLHHIAGVCFLAIGAFLVSRS